jgi:hypothetical protein
VVGKAPSTLSKMSPLAAYQALTAGRKSNLRQSPWEGGHKTEVVARRASLDEDTARCALEDLVRRRMVTIDDRNYWRKTLLG